MKFNEFVGKIRTKYPDAYQELSDTELGFRIITKHPVYLEQIDASSIPNPYKANENLSKGYMHEATEKERLIASLGVDPLGQEFVEAKAFYDQRLGIDHTPTMLEQQVSIEYGRNETLKGANQKNKEAALLQFEKQNKFLQAFDIFWEGLKVAGKQAPEYIVGNLAKFGLASQYGMTQPMYANPNFIQYQKDITKSINQIENTESFQLARKAVKQDAELRDAYIEKFRNPTSQSLAKSFSEGNWSQVGKDVFDLALLELPNFLTIIGASLVNPALGLAYVGTTSGSQRYAEGIANGESVEEASANGNAYAIAEIVFGKLGEIGLIESAVRRTAKREFSRSFAQKAVDLAREPVSEMATTITQNLVDDRKWNEGIVESAVIGGLYGGSVNVAITLGDAARTRKQNTDAEIDAIIEQDPVLSETPERARLAEDALKRPDAKNVNNLNQDIFKEEEIAPVAEPTVTKEVKVYPPKPDEDVVIIDESLEALSDNELDILEKDLNKQLAKLEDKLVPSITDEGLFQNFTQEEINELINVRRQIDSLEIETFRRQREIIEEGDEAFYTLEDMAADFLNIARDNRFVAESPNEGLAKLGILINIANKNNSLKEVANIIDSQKQRLRDADEIEVFDIALNNLNLKVNEIKNIQKEASTKQTPLAIAEPAPVAEPTEPQELKSVEQMRREIDVTEDSFADIQNNLEEDVNPVADEVNKTRSKFINNVMTPLLSAVEDINPQVGNRLRKFEFDVHRKKRDDGREILGFLEEMTDLAKKDSYKFTQVSDMLLNGEYKKAEKVVGKENLTKVRKLMEKYADELETVGFDVSRQTDYFPRRVKDYEGLKDELGQEIADKIDEALAEQQEKAIKKGYVLSTIEESKIINNVITGAYRPVGGVKPRALKERKIEEITSDISPYYYDATESLMMYLDEAADVIEMRKLFGKDLQLDGDVVDINESIGAYINEISKGLEGKDRTDLISLFRTRFSYRPTGKKLQRYKTLVGLTTLGQVQNAITQMGDMTWSVYENGFANTLKAAFGDKKITTEDLGVKEVAAEFRTFDGLRGALDTVFKYSGFRKIDQLGKETLVNSTLLEYQQQAKDGKFDRKKQERLDVLFPTKEKQQEVIQQLKDGKSTEDIDFLMFSTLLDYQPVTLSNMPVKYLEMPNGRVLYTLKTFTIKQLDTYRQNGVDNIQRGIASGDKELIKRGFSDLLRLVGIFYLMNVPTDLLKDWMSGKKIYLTDTLVDNFYKLLGVSRYNVEYATRGGRKPSELLVRTVVPPFSFIDVPFNDLISIMSNLKKGEKTDISKLESWRFLPFVGRTLYYTVGKGKEKEEKKAKQKEKEK